MFAVFTKDDETPSGAFELISVFWPHLNVGVKSFGKFGADDVIVGHGVSFLVVPVGEFGGCGLRFLPCVFEFGDEFLVLCVLYFDGFFFGFAEDERM